MNRTEAFHKLMELRRKIHANKEDMRSLNGKLKWRNVILAMMNNENGMI